ncbi:hypothetical protein CYMTET_4201 [Cymbomonas tetramitiformis]|uniref:Crossover junction endonuclease MUS81 n=1 Tax=Cymbomonas tetramitiformis TaxID=36881 RepID=A0AAE0H1T8_9CHLO|nr:hypothetical protein CYMTET_4201 [Cymbomonas tetramitiformis]
MARLIVDTREPAHVHDALTNFGVSYERATLDVADFHIYRDNRLLFTVERKTWSDLEASCVDGRARDQLLRAASNARSHNAQHVVLLEHASVLTDAQLRNCVYGKDNRGLRARSTVDRLVLQHGVGVLRTANVMETARTLQWILEKSIKERWAPEGGQHTCGAYYGGSVQSKKSANDGNPQAAWTRMLQTVRGVSETAAKAIAETYPNAKSIVDAANATDNSKRLLDAIASVQTSKKRKLGKSTAGRVIAALCGPT